MTEIIAQDMAGDDPETCRKGRIWLGWCAGVLAGFTVAATVAGYAAMLRHGQASEFSYARNDAALQAAATLADSFPHGYR